MDSLDELAARCKASAKNRITHTQNKHIYTPNIHIWSGIRTHDPSFRAREDSSCLREHSDCDRPQIPFLLLATRPSHHIPPDVALLKILGCLWAQKLGESWSPRQGVPCSGIPDENGLQLWRGATNILDKQLRRERDELLARGLDAGLQH
jgi:hypothetical protein